MGSPRQEHVDVPGVLLPGFQKHQQSLEDDLRLMDLALRYPDRLLRGSAGLIARMLASLLHQGTLTSVEQIPEKCDLLRDLFRSILK